MRQTLTSGSLWCSASTTRRPLGSVNVCRGGSWNADSGPGPGMTVRSTPTAAGRADGVSGGSGSTRATSRPAPRYRRAAATTASGVSSR